MWANNTQTQAPPHTHTCAHTPCVFNDHIRRTRRRWWQWSRLSIWWPSLRRFPSLIFMLQRAFASVPWNMDAVRRGETAIQCHMRTDRKRNWWRVFQKSELKGKCSQSIFLSAFFNSAIWIQIIAGDLEETVRGMWSTVKLGRAGTCTLGSCVREKEK